MIGLDTNFVIASELRIHPQHERVHLALEDAIRHGETFAICPQVIAEFIHIVTDGKRLTDPLTVPEAVRQAELWSTALDVTTVLPEPHAMSLFFHWMTIHRLGRKRVLDTLMAATYAANGVTRLATLNSADFVVFGAFEILNY